MIGYRTWPPRMTGSNKQVEWAEKIHSSMFKKIGTKEADRLLDYGGPVHDSRFWIDNRYKVFTVDDIFEVKSALKSLQITLSPIFENQELREAQYQARQQIIQEIMNAKVFVEVGYFVFFGFDPYHEIKIIHEKAEMKRRRAIRDAK